MYSRTFPYHNGNIKYKLYATKKMWLVESDVPTAQVTKSSITWDTTPFSLLEVNRHFGTCCLRLQYGNVLAIIKNKPSKKPA
jgi:hypothetical protein